MNALLRKMEHGMGEAGGIKYNGSDTDYAERPLKARVPVQQSPDKKQVHKACSRSLGSQITRIPRKNSCLNLVESTKYQTGLSSGVIEGISSSDKISTGKESVPLLNALKEDRKNRWT